MATNKLILENVLSQEEYDQIDRFCTAHSGLDSLPQLADFLKKQFSVELVLDQDIVKGYSTDSSNLPGNAHGLFRPKSKRDCAIIFRACFKAHIPATISAGKSNLTGSATPKGGIVVSTTKMLSPASKVDESSMTVSTPVGLILEDLRNLVLRESNNTLLFPVDPTSRKDACVGGTLACNSSGFTPGKPGSMRNWIDSLEFLFPNGLAISAQKGEYISNDGKFILCQNGKRAEFPIPQYERPTFKNASGPYSSSDGTMDIVDLIIGSEGIFGLVMACTLRLQKHPDDYLDFFFSLPTEEDALAFYNYFYNYLSGNLSTLSAFEYFGIHCRKYMNHETRLFYSDDQAAIYLQIPLFNKTIEDTAEKWFEIIINSQCNIDKDAVILLDNEQDRNIFFEARHSLAANTVEIVKQRGTFITATDTIVPPENFSEFIKFGNNLIQSHGIDYLLFGHLGDCHIHFQILPTKEQLEKVIEIYDKLVDKSSELGGLYSAEHGTGKRKCKDFIKCYGPESVEQVKRSKRAIDPQFLLNRGNVVDFD